jgi:hypothetical protein
MIPKNNQQLYRCTICASLLFFAATLCRAQNPDLQVCASQGFSLISAEDADGVGTITYQWYEDGIPIENSNTTTISIPAGAKTTGTYAYVRVAGNAACTLSSNTYTVEVTDAPDAPTMSGDGAQCGGVRQISATPGTGGNGIRWTDNNSTSQMRSATATGTYYAVTTSANGCESAQATVAVTINPLPSAPSMSGGGTYCSWPRNIYAYPGAGGNGIRWTSDNSTNQTRSVSSTGTYYAVTTSAAGCESVSQSVQIIFPAPSSDGQAPSYCGCASGLEDCSNVCRQCCSISEMTFKYNGGTEVFNNVAYRSEENCQTICFNTYGCCIYYWRLYTFDAQCICYK